MSAENLLAAAFPQFFPKHWLENSAIAFTDFPSRVRVGYVVRQEGCYSYIMEDTLSELHISVRELHAAAIANLAGLGSASISIARVPGGAEGWISAEDDDFAAVRIRLPSVQREFSEALGEEFLVAIPQRDDCFCWSLTQQSKRQDKHAHDALEEFLREDYNLTPDILHYSIEGFRLHLEQVVV
jgi:uncharacterized protein YtpQ (UPF0354 family)